MKNGVNKDSRSFLIHTISVNLSILKAELEELTAIQKQDDSQASQRAADLLSAASNVAASADSRLNVASVDELQELLSEVFGAMSKTTDARRLLGACRPFDELSG